MLANFFGHLHGAKGPAVVLAIFFGDQSVSDRDPPGRDPRRDGRFQEHNFRSDTADNFSCTDPSIVVYSS